MLRELSQAPDVQLKIMESQDDQVDVTEQFKLLFRVLFCQSVLFMVLLCSCCCTGKTHAHFYDRMFIVYGFLLLLSVGTYVWACYLTTRYTSKVCSGDFLDKHGVELESAMLDFWDIEHRFYLVRCSHLLNWYLVLESMFFFCCSCASMTWVFV